MNDRSNREWLCNSPCAPSWSRNAGVRWISGWLLIFSIAGASARADEGVSLEKLAAAAPASTPLFVAAADLGRLEEGWRQTAFFDVYQAESMQPFFTEVRERHGGILPTESLGLPWSDLRDAASGGAAYIRWPTKSSGLGALLVADSGKNPASASAGLATVRKVWQARGFEVSDENLFGTQVVQAKLQLRPDPKSTIQPLRYAFVYQNWLVVCDRAAVAEEFLTRLRSTVGDSLATLPAFDEIMRTGEPAQRGAGSLYWYADPWQLWRASLDVKSSSGHSSLRRLNFYQRQGFGAIVALGGVVKFGSADKDVDFELRVILHGGLSKGAGLLSLSHGNDFKIASWLPKSPAGIAVLYWNLPAAIKAYGSIYDELYGENYDGAFEELLRSIETDADGPQAFVRRDVLDRLDSKIFGVVDYRGAKGDGNPTGKRALLAAATNDPAKTATAIERFFAGEDEVVMTSEHDARIWKTKKPGRSLFGSRPDDPLSLQISALAVAHGHLLVGSDADLVSEAVLAPADDSKNTISSTPFPSLPRDGVSARSFSELRADAEADFALARQNKLLGADSWSATLIYWLFFAARSTDTSSATVDCAKLPAFATVQAHWGLETVDVEPLQSGWLLHGVIRNPRTK